MSWRSRGIASVFRPAERLSFGRATLFILVLGPMLVLGVSGASTSQNTAEEDWTMVHRRDDESWAMKSGLSAATVRGLRELAKVPDDMPGVRIDNLDAKTLRFRGQVLLVLGSGNGHCLSLYVFGRTGSTFREIWSAEGLPDGAGFCRENPRDPEAYATREGRIVVKIPTDTDWDAGAINAATLHYVFGWNGKTYSLIGRRKLKNPHYPDAQRAPRSKH